MRKYRLHKGFGKQPTTGDSTGVFNGRDHRTTGRSSSLLITLTRSVRMGRAPTVFVVDPDASVRQSLESAIRRVGWNPEIASSPRPFLARPRAQTPSCLLLDVGDFLPDLSGFELLRRVATDRKEIPVVAMSGEPSIPLAVRAIQAGALEFLTKPLTDDVLRAAVGRALAQSQAVLRQEADWLQLRQRLDSLSGRERDVMVRVVSGLLNKQVGADLGISEITVKA